MATLQEQQLAKDIVVAWLSISASSNSVISDTIRNPTTAGDLIANVYKTIVQAISDTSTVAARTDATGCVGRSVAHPVPERPPTSSEHWCRKGPQAHDPVSDPHPVAPDRTPVMAF
jgi:hypothetical protein